MAKTLTQVGIETGNLVEAYHVTQSIDAFTGVDAYDISLSGSLNITGSLSQGSGTQVSGVFSHAEGQSTQAIGDGSHAEGQSTQAIGEYSHAEGIETTAQGAYSHAEGDSTTAIGTGAHAEGASTTATGPYSHAEGSNTQAIGAYSHAEGLGTRSSGSYQHVQGQFNLSSSAQSAFIVGNGTSDASRSNLVFASGSQFQVTGSVIATTGFTGSLQGTASFAVTASHVISASFAVTASHVISASYAVTASHVDLLAGPNITINKVGTTFEISGSGGGGGITPAETGSFYISSSVNLNTITFHQGDGTTESVTVNTGSLSIPSSISQFGGVNIVEVTTGTYQIPNSGSYRIFQNRTIGSLCTITMPTTASVGDVIEIYEVPSSVRTKIAQNGSGATGQTIGAFSYTTSVGTLGSIVTRTGSALGVSDDSAYLKLLCYNAGSGTSVGQKWQVVEFSSNYWFQQNTYGPFDIVALIGVI
jgi:hypothetical protein